MPRHRFSSEEARAAGKKSRRRKGPGCFGSTKDPTSSGRRGGLAKEAARRALRHRLGPLDTVEHAERWAAVISDPDLPVWLWAEAYGWWSEGSERLLRKMMESALTE